MNTFSKSLHTQEDHVYFLITICSTLFLPFYSADSQAFFPFLKYAPSYLRVSGQANPSAKFAHPCPLSTHFPSLPHIDLTIPTYFRVYLKRLFHMAAFNAPCPFLSLPYSFRLGMDSSVKHSHSTKFFTFYST